MKKTIDAVDRLLDQVIDDPDKFIDRVERAAEHTAKGVNQLVERYERDPEGVKREARDFLIRAGARFGKKKLRDAR